jgi:hypothetical protein
MFRIFISEGTTVTNVTTKSISLSGAGKLPNVTVVTDAAGRFWHLSLKEVEK